MGCLRPSSTPCSDCWLFHRAADVSADKAGSQCACESVRQNACHMSMISTSVSVQHQHRRVDKGRAACHAAGPRKPSLCLQVRSPQPLWHRCCYPSWVPARCALFGLDPHRAHLQPLGTLSAQIAEHQSPPACNSPSLSPLCLLTSAGATAEDAPTSKPDSTSPSRPLRPSYSHQAPTLLRSSGEGCSSERLD